LEDEYAGFGEVEEGGATFDSVVYAVGVEMCVFFFCFEPPGAMKIMGLIT
jgi:hypothetical protein